MNMLDVNFLLTYLNLILLLVFFALWVINSTKRHRQWLIKSLLLGLPIGPLIIMATNGAGILENVSYLNGNWGILEISILSGLSWAIAATWLLTLRLVPPASVAVSIHWPKVLSFYIVLIVATYLSRQFNISSSIIIITSLGFSSIILAARQPKLLAYASLSGIAYMTLCLVVVYFATMLNPNIAHGQLPLTTIPLLLSPTSVVVAGFLALSSPIVSQWWFGQPLNDVK